MGVRIEGIEAHIKSLKRMKKDDLAGLVRASISSATRVLEVALSLVPREYGDLAATGRVEVNMGSMADGTVIVAFGGVSPTGRVVDYAVIVHEDMTASHAPGTGAKYLERAVRRTRVNMTQLVKKEIEKT